MMTVEVARRIVRAARPDALCHRFKLDGEPPLYFVKARQGPVVCWPDAPTEGQAWKLAAGAIIAAESTPSRAATSASK
jgi:hypothetical protein